MKKKETTLKIKKNDIAKLKNEWSYKTNSFDSVEVSGALEYLKPIERIKFMNELYRVLKIGSKASIVTPYWASQKAYADLSYEFPPIVEGWLFFLSKEWRDNNDVTDKRYKCNFEATWGYGMHPSLVPRNQEYQQHALTFWKEACQELVVSLTKK
jgi:SAM-dependent methyltransferase